MAGAVEFIPSPGGKCTEPMRSPDGLLWQCGGVCYPGVARPRTGWAQEPPLVRLCTGRPLHFRTIYMAQEQRQYPASAASRITFRRL
jgi:hypothetical protein